MTRKFVPALLVGGVLAMTLGAASAQEQVVNLYSARHYSTDEALYNAKHGGRNRTMLG